MATEIQPPTAAGDDTSDVLYNIVLIIGAGVSGICLTAQLELQHSLTDLHIYEKYADVGGTWFINSYPGCACDVSADLYSFSFSPHPSTWSKPLPDQPETLAYVRSVARKYQVYERTSFNCTVTRCVWREDVGRWRVWVQTNASDSISREFVHECKVLFAATGMLDTPSIPSFPGRERFRGAVMHSARWDDSTNVFGKKVIVVGNGCSGAQVVQGVHRLQASSVIHLYTSPAWFEPSGSFPGPPALRFLLPLYRFLLFLLYEHYFFAFYNNPFSRWLRSKFQAAAESFMRSRTPPQVQAGFIPDFDFGCKRRVIAGGYFDVPAKLYRIPGIKEFTERGLRTVDGVEYEADIIVLATGFLTNQFMYGIEVVGVGGVSAQEHWKITGGPAAYNTCAMAGFPNLFLTMGPNSATGHTSALIFIEIVVDHALKMIKPVLSGRAKKIEVKIEAEKRFVRDVREALEGMVWSGACGGWYAKGGINGTIWPWSSFWFWYRVAFPVWSDWIVE